MPNVIVRVARYLLRSRKRSASLQNSTTSSGSSPAQNTLEAPSTEPIPPRRLKEPEVQNGKIERIKCEENAGEQPPKRVVDRSLPKSSESVKSQSGSQTNSEARNSSKQTTKVLAIQMSSATPQSTTVRSRRVLRELQVMMKASERPECSFEVSLVDDSNIFEWDVRLLKVDESSDLWRSMQQTGTECIRFRLTFPELFPFQPPFMRLVGPYLDNGFIMDGGAICMEVLTPQGWSSAYTVESLLVQVASGLTTGGAVISHKQKRKYNQLTQKRAETEFRRICKIHAKHGWVSMEREDA